jgi:hypothetical protein
MSRPSLCVTAVVLALCCCVGAAALDLDVGAGIAIDVAPYGIETVAPMALVAAWVGPPDGWQAGLLVAATLSRSVRDAEAAACLRIWALPGHAALYGGGGLIAGSDADPVIEPYLIGGLRLQAGRIAFFAPGLTMRLKSGGTDSGLWLAAIWSP